MTGQDDKESGFSYTYCAGRVGIVLVVFGVVYAALSWAGVELPLGVSVMVMVLAVTGFFTLVTFWFLVRIFKALNVLFLVVSLALTVFFSVRSIIIPVVRRAPEAPIFPALTTALIHSPALIFLVVSATLAVALVKPAKP